MKIYLIIIMMWLALIGLTSCDTSDTKSSNEPPEAGDLCLNSGTLGATSTCLSATQPESYYVDEALLYFDTLDLTAPETNIPDYHEQVARWEWPPWLILTGFGAEDMVNSGLALRRIDPSTVPERNCQFFPIQPFARCYVVFEYEGGLCPIYEEFTFNDEGKMTFIEAWSHDANEGDEPAWGERDDFPRLSTRVPGLGVPRGTIPYSDPEVIMLAETKGDSEVMDYLERIKNWRLSWAAELGSADRNFFAKGCGW